MIYLMDVLDLTHIDPPCDQLFSNGSNMNLSLYQVFLKLSSSSQDFNLIYFELFKKARDPKALGYPLTPPLNQTLGGG